MGLHEGKTFSEKHGADAKPDIATRDEILKYAKNNELPCALAFQIAEDLEISASLVGKNIDLLNFKLIKCQLGLFGYPKKKIVKARPDADEELKAAIRDALSDNRLPCKKAWEFASRFKIPRTAVSGACEAMNIKIKPCQLGAF
ncbi:hypothetical protein QUF80_23170 [Desulfococcaceae bacterium HSG8]|nr:hypothetical protein [Desulfococcaceae bacterium HSG8]